MRQHQRKAKGKQNQTAQRRALSCRHSRSSIATECWSTEALLMPKPRMKKMQKDARNQTNMEKKEARLQRTHAKVPSNTGRHPQPTIVQELLLSRQEIAQTPPRSRRSKHHTRLQLSLMQGFWRNSRLKWNVASVGKEWLLLTAD